MEHYAVYVALSVVIYVVYRILAVGKKSVLARARFLNVVAVTYDAVVLLGVNGKLYFTAWEQGRGDCLDGWNGVA